MDKPFFIISGRKVLLQSNCFVLDHPHVAICFLDALVQLARFSKHASASESVTIEQLVGEIIKVQTDYANSNILHSFQIRLQQE